MCDYDISSFNKLAEEVSDMKHMFKMMFEKFDSINPQIASSLCSPLTRWTKFDEGRSNLMRRELKRLSETKKISKDLYEIVSKSL